MSFNIDTRVQPRNIVEETFSTTDYQIPANTKNGTIFYFNNTGATDHRDLYLPAASDFKKGEYFTIVNCNSGSYRMHIYVKSGSGDTIFVIDTTFNCLRDDAHTLVSDGVSNWIRTHDLTLA